MPALENVKHELFAQELVKGASQREAYKTAGYSAKSDSVADAAASRLFSEVKVRARIEELQNRGAARAEVTVQKILEELDEARVLARTIDQPSAMVQASMGRAKVAGIIVERKEVGKPGDFSNLSDEELDSVLAQTLQAVTQPEPAKRNGKTKH